MEEWITFAFAYYVKILFFICFCFYKKYYFRFNSTCSKNTGY